MSNAPYPLWAHLLLTAGDDISEVASTNNISEFTPIEKPSSTNNVDPLTRDVKLKP